MSIPGRDENPLAPARRSRARAHDSTSTGITDADVDRGLAAAVLGALGRLQLRLDVIDRQHAEAFAALRDAVTALDARLDGIERSLVPLTPVADVADPGSVEHGIAD